MGQRRRDAGLLIGVPLLTVVSALGGTAACEKAPATPPRTTGASPLGTASRPEPTRPLVRRPPDLRRAVAQRLGPAPHRDPLNLYDIGLSGTPDGQTVGRMDGHAVSLLVLDHHGGGAFRRVARRIYRARDAAWLWLVEQHALQRAARRAGIPLPRLLRREFRRLPPPTPAELRPLLASTELDHLPAGERQRAARSLWRQRRWEDRRARLVLSAMAELRFERFGFGAFTAAVAKPDAVVARIDGVPVTRAQRRRLAGLRAARARREYHDLLRTRFHKYVDRHLLARDAQRRGADARGQTPRPGPARDRLLARLRKTARIELLAQPPPTPRFAIDIPFPRDHGPSGAGPRIVAFHGLGCVSCARGTRLLLSLMSAFGGRLALRAGDGFSTRNLASYRGALALRCAPAGPGRDALLKALAGDFGSGYIEDLIRRAATLGIPRAPFQRCLEEDRHFPEIHENLRVAWRMGLEGNLPGIFVKGIRIDPRADPRAVLRQVKAALR